MDRFLAMRTVDGERTVPARIRGMQIEPARANIGNSDGYTLLVSPEGPHAPSNRRAALSAVASDAA